MKEIKLFLAYAPEDEEYKEELSKHLSALKEDGHIAEWSAVELLPGADQMAVLRKKMSQSDIIALLLSADFLGTDHGKDLEEMAFAQKAKKGTVLVPIKIRAVPLSDSYAQFSMLPDQSRPVDDPSWGSRDMAYTNIAEGLKKLAVAMQGEEDRKGNVVRPPKKPVSPPSPSNPRPPAKPINMKLILGGVGVVILALALWLVPPLLKDDDKIAYDAAKIENTIDSYKSYVNQFPEGNYVAEAQRTINDLELADEKEKHDKAWADAKEVDDKTAYNIYLRAYPQGANKAAAEARILELSTAEEDDKAFERATTANSVNAFLQYMAEYKDGRHVADAKTGLKTLLTKDGCVYYGEANTDGRMKSDRFFDKVEEEKDSKPKNGDLIISKQGVTVRYRCDRNSGNKGSVQRDKIAYISEISSEGSHYWVKILYQ